MATAMTLATPCEASHAGSAGAAERAVDRLGEDVLAIHAQAKAGERDAELRGRDVAILELRIAEDSLNTLRQAVALRGTRLDGRARRPDDRELRGDEDGVQQDEDGDDRELDHRASSRLRRGGRRRAVLNSSATPPSSSATTSSRVIRPMTLPAASTTSA